MKKYLSLIGLAIGLFLLPFVVHASVDASKGFCSKKTDDGEYVTCTFAAVVKEDKEFTVTLTPKGGAEITAVEAISGSDWKITQNENEGVYTVSVSYDSPEDLGEVEATLFTYKYKKSGTEDCKILISVGGKDFEETPVEEKKETPKGKCTKSDGKYYIDGSEVTEAEYKNACPKTGVTLPYVALITIALVAAGAYVATRNKAKMYKL